MQSNYTSKYPTDIDSNYINTRVVLLKNSIKKEQDSDRLHAMRSELQYLLYKQELLGGGDTRDE